MVAPLDIQGVVLHEQIEDFIWVRSPVKYVPHNMQMVDGKAFDKLCKGNNEFLRCLDMDDGVYNLPMVFNLVVVLIHLHMQQFVNDIGKFLRHGFTDF